MPYLLDRDVYEETKDIVLGKRTPSPLVREMAEWCKATYGVTVLNLYFGKHDLPHSTPFYVHLVLETTADVQTMSVNGLKWNPDYEAQVAGRFRHLAIKHGLADRSQLEPLVVAYNDFSLEARADTRNRAHGEIRTEIKQSYPMVWRVDGVSPSDVVFYYTDADVRRYADDGTSAAITDTYYSILKQYDDLDVVTRDNISLRFDSKENVDKNYQGNLFYYFR